MVLYINVILRPRSSWVSSTSVAKYYLSIHYYITIYVWINWFNLLSVSTNPYIPYNKEVIDFINKVNFMNSLFPDIFTIGEII